MLNQKQILEYAVKGLSAEIEELEKQVKKGYDLVKKIDNGEKVNSSKTKFEILEICRVKKAESARLDREKFDLSWQVNVEMND